QRKVHLVIPLRGLVCGVLSVRDAKVAKGLQRKSSMSILMTVKQEEVTCRQCLILSEGRR
ncbi:hypothetical protein LCGC14_2002190, partial [marine sediment metagenome]